MLKGVFIIKTEVQGKIVAAEPGDVVVEAGFVVVAPDLFELGKRKNGL